MHVERIKLLIAPDMVHVSMRIEKFDRQRCKRHGDVAGIMKLHPRIDQKRPVFSLKKEDADTVVFDAPGIRIHLYDLVIHFIFSI